jgi:hypothetical protein
MKTLQLHHIIKKTRAFVNLVIPPGRLADTLTSCLVRTRHKIYFQINSRESAGSSVKGVKKKKKTPFNRCFITVIFYIYITVIFKSTFILKV